jgi:hypothetical protein
MMDTTDTITVTIPSNLLNGLTLGEDEIRQALLLGLNQLRQQRAADDSTNRVVQALQSTGRIRHLSTESVEDEGLHPARQTPPTLPGPSVSDILIAQRKGEL